MSLRGAREVILGLLEDAGIQAYYGWGPFSTPCARIFPGEPWVGRNGLAGGRVIQRWEIWSVAGRVDGSATFDEVEELVQRINNAVAPTHEWGHIEWHRPVISDMGGTRYLACRGIIETLMEV